MRQSPTYILAAALLFVAAMLSPGTLWGQAAVSGNLTGVVTDESQAVIPNVEIALTNDATGVKFTARTNEVGAYSFPNLSPGTYTLTAEAAGFSPARLTGIGISVAQFARQNIRLKVGTVAERVEVAATTGVIETERAALSSVVTSKQITQLPLNGRYSIFPLIYLAPGVQNTGYWNNVWASGGFRTGGMGSTVDGAINLINQNGAMSPATPPLDSIEEFRFITNNASAEYSFGSAQLVLVTRSGTNQLHGSAFWFNRNREFAAKQALDHRAKPPFNRNEFGYTIGGPIKRDKLFFFHTFEQLSQRLSSVRNYFLPTATQRTGNFSGLAPIIDPLSGEPFPNNQIPSTRIPETARFLTGYYPSPNMAGSGPLGTGLNMIDVSRSAQDSPRFTIKLDYAADSNNNLSGGFKFFNDGPALQSTGPGDRYGASWQGFKQRQVHFAWTRILSPTMTNELRFGHTTNGYSPSAQNQDVDPGTLLPGLDDQCCGDLTGGMKSNIGRYVNGLPTININSYTGFWDNSKADNYFRDINISNNLTYIRGGHQLKFGGYWYRHQGYWGGQYDTGRGIMNFTGRYTGDAFADFLLGYANTSQRGPAYQIGDYNTKHIGGFVQDDWQVNRKLTLNFGLRWDVITSPHEKDYRQAIFMPEKNAIVTFSGTDQFPPKVVSRLLGAYPIMTSVQAGLGTPKTPAKTQWGDFQPRVGFAYRPFGDTRTVIRAGAGLYYGYEGTINLGLSQVLNSAPFALLENFESPAGRTPHITFATPFPGTGNIPTNPTVYGFPRDYPHARNLQWNFNIERELANRTMVRIGYVGSKATHLYHAYDYNLPRVPGAGALQAQRPLQPWGGVTWWDPRGNAYTNQLQLEFVRRVSDLTIQFNYQFTRAISDGATDADGWYSTAVDNPFDASRNRGNTDGIRRHYATTNWVYEFPFGRQRKFLTGIPQMLDYVIGGWQVNGIATFGTGTPFSVLYSDGRVGYPASGRADLVGNPFVDNPTAGGWFNPAAFKAPAQFGWGTSGRNILWNPGSWNFDLGLMKNFRFGERYQIQVRSEWFNAFNHPNLGGVNASLANPSVLGTVTSYSSARVILFGAKFAF